RLDGGQSGADAPSGIENVIDEHDVFIFYQEIYFGGICFQCFFPTPEIVPKKRNIQKSQLNVLDLVFVLQNSRQPFCKIAATRLDADQYGIAKIIMVFYKLTSQSVKNDV